MSNARRSSLSHVGAPCGQAFSRAAVEEQLERILSSPEFTVTERGRRFLKYVVTEMLEGRGDRIKAFSIAVEVFGRDSSFEPLNDPVVRTEAARVRRGLERYYFVAGTSDSIMIEIPKGGYVPSFAFRDTAPRKPEPGEGYHARPAPNSGGRRSAWATLVAGLLILAGVLGSGLIWFQSTPLAPRPPRLLVATFQALGGKPVERVYAIGLVDQLITQFSRFKEIQVIGIETSRAAESDLSLGAARRDLDADFVLEGSVSATDQGIRVSARLVETATKVLLWSNTYAGDLRARNLIDIQTEIADQVTTAVARPYGIVFQAEVRQIPPGTPDDLDAYLCVLSYYVFRSSPTAQGHAAGRTCLEKTVALFPSYATAWAMLSYAYLDEYRWGFNVSSPGSDAIVRALEAARTAVRLEPENVRALQAHMMALFFSRDVAGALGIAERALALNPNDTEIIGEVGTRVGLTGDWNRAIGLLERALDANPGHSDYYRSNLAFALYMQGNVKRAVEEIRRANQDKLPMYQLLAAIIYAEGGLTADAKAARERFMALRPAFFENLDSELQNRNFRPEDRSRFIAGAVNAGFPVPASLREAPAHLTR